MPSPWISTTPPALSSSLSSSSSNALHFLEKVLKNKFSNLLWTCYNRKNDHHTRSLKRESVTLPNLSIQPYLCLKLSMYLHLSVYECNTTTTACQIVWKSEDSEKSEYCMSVSKVKLKRNKTRYATPFCIRKRMDTWLGE